MPWCWVQLKDITWKLLSSGWFSTWAMWWPYISAAQVGALSLPANGLTKLKMMLVGVGGMNVCMVVETPWTCSEACPTPNLILQSISRHLLNCNCVCTHLHTPLLFISFQSVKECRPQIAQLLVSWCKASPTTTDTVMKVCIARWRPTYAVGWRKRWWRRTKWLDLLL